MPVTFPEIHVGDPIRCEGLSVFPLFTGNGDGGVPYVLSDEAISSDAVTVTEVSEGGSVPDLLVENSGDARVLFLEGEELIGAKQNRVLNVSVLVAAQAKTPVPVSCVEAGRWGYRSRKFGSGSHSPSKLRHLLKKGVSASLKAKRGHRSDQGEVWKEVERQQRVLGASSGTSAMSDTFDAYKDRVREYQEKLQPVEGAVGLAIGIDDKIVCVDILDKPATCQKVWTRLLTGYVLDALEVPAGEKQADREAVAALLAGLNGLPWSEAETVGEGQDFRSETDDGVLASVLTFEGHLVHGSVSISA